MPNIEQPKITVPRREALIAQLQSANRNAAVWVVLQVVLLAVIMYWLDFDLLLREPLLSLTAVGLVVMPTLLGLAQFWAQKKKEIGDLREDTRFGVFDKHRLARLRHDTLQRLGLPDERIPVFITADKSLNASAVRLGLAGWFKSFNGIYLNRQLLHHLEPEEVQDIMGHELGHYYQHYLVSDRFRVLTIVLGGTIGLLVAQWIGLESYLAFVGVAICSWLFWKLAGLQWARHGTTIEYLCDDFGAQVHDVIVSINGLLKLGLDSELQLAIQREAILSGQNGQLSAREVVAAVEAAIPYGRCSREEIEERIEKQLRERRAAAQSKSLAGFLNYLWNSDVEAEAEEELQEQARSLKRLELLPRLAWEEVMADKSRVHITEQEMPRLIALIESQPQAVLFRLPESASATDDVHPPLRERILYLWYNRPAIEQAAVHRRQIAWISMGRHATVVHPAG